MPSTKHLKSWFEWRVEAMNLKNSANLIIFIVFCSLSSLFVGCLAVYPRFRDGEILEEKVSSSSSKHFNIFSRNGKIETVKKIISIGLCTSWNKDLAEKYLNCICLYKIIPNICWDRLADVALNLTAADFFDLVVAALERGGAVGASPGVVLPISSSWTNSLVNFIN